MCTHGNLGPAVMRRRADPERERRTGVFCWNDAICSVGDGGRTADWLCRLRPIEGKERLLILPHPLTGVDLSALCADALCVDDGGGLPLAERMIDAMEHLPRW